MKKLAIVLLMLLISVNIFSQTFKFNTITYFTLYKEGNFYFTLDDKSKIVTVGPHYSIVDAVVPECSYRYRNVKDTIVNTIVFHCYDIGQGTKFLLSLDHTHLISYSRGINDAYFYDTTEQVDKFQGIGE